MSAPHDPASPRPRDAASPPSVRFGPYEADFRAGELRKYGRRVRLQSKPLTILEVLVARAGEVVPREDLQRALWPDGVFVDFEKNLNTAVNKLRGALCDAAEAPRYIETIPKRGYRFLVPIEVARLEEEAVGQGMSPAPDGGTAGAAAQGAAPTAMALEASDAGLPGVVLGRGRRALRTAAIGLGLLLLLALASAVVWLRGPSAWLGVPRALPPGATVVLGDFANSTGDPVFDGTLRQALSVEMERSHSLALLSDARVAQTLALMAQPSGTGLTPEVARTVCIRAGGVAAINGSIAKLGNDYALWLGAVDCATGEQIGQEQATAGDKDQVLPALAAAALDLRRTMGEKLAGARKGDVPPDNVTTTSLEALQAYTLGYRVLVVENESARAMPFFERAIRLDPSFAMAYARLGKCYDSLDQFEQAARNFRQAFQLRNRASERERFYIDAYYDYVVTGELEAAREHFESWAQVFPSDAQPHASLGNIYADLGDYERSQRERATALRLDSAIGLNHGNRVWSEMALGRFDQARGLARAAQEAGLDSPSIHLALLQMAWTDGDEAAWRREADGLMGRPGAEEAVLDVRQQIAIGEGAFAQAEGLARAAADGYARHDQPEGAARVEAGLAVAEALTDRRWLSREAAAALVARAASKYVKAGAAIALALAGETMQASAIASRLERDFPLHTVVQRNYVPAIRAAIALRRQQPGEAIEALQAAGPYERGRLGYFMLPVYLRGQALLEKGDGRAAAIEFKKICDYPGPVVEIVGPLARLGLARAHRAAGNTEAAKGAYQAFFVLWRHADEDIPVLRAARREYSSLR